MLLVLDEGLNEQPDEFFAGEISALENLAIAIREGKHILLGSRDFLDRLSKLSFISASSTASFKKCHEQLPEYANLKNIISDYIKVVPNGNDAISVVNGQGIISIPFSRFADTAMIQEVILLCENLVDCDFYGIVAKVYASVKKIGTLKMRYDGRLGGGSTIVDVYQKIQDEAKRPCLCIADSDKKYPTGNLGDNIKRLGRIDETTKPLTRYIHLLCREAENMLSCQQIELACTMDEPRLQALQSLNNVEKHDDEARLFIDIKNGLESVSIFKLPIGNPNRNYWIDFLSSYCGANGYKNHCLDENDCFIKEDTCELKEEGSCECTIINGFGDNIFENVVMKLKMQTGQKVAELLSSSVYDEWIRVGHTVFSWCIGRNRRSAL